MAATTLRIQSQQSPTTSANTPSPPTLKTLKPFCFPADKQRPSPPLASPCTPISFTKDPPPHVPHPPPTPPSVGSALTRSTHSTPSTPSPPAPLIRPNPRPARLRSELPTTVTTPLSTRPSALSPARLRPSRRQRRAFSHMLFSTASHRSAAAAARRRQRQQQQPQQQQQHNADHDESEQRSRRRSHVGAFRAAPPTAGADVISALWHNIPLVPFQNRCIQLSVVFTNAIRSELNDMRFLLFLLRDTARSASAPRSLRNLDADFELWFCRFSHFVQLLLVCVQQELFQGVQLLLERRDVMTSGSVASAQVDADMSYVQAWKGTCHTLHGCISRAVHQLCTAENRVLLLTARRRVCNNGNRMHLVASATEAVSALHRVLVPLLDSLDAACESVLSLNVGQSACDSMLGAFVHRLVHCGTKELPALGWSACITLTRWIESKKTRGEVVNKLARLGKVSVLGRCLADQSHHTVIRVYRQVWAKRAG